MPGVLVPIIHLLRRARSYAAFDAVFSHLAQSLRVVLTSTSDLLGGLYLSGRVPLFLVKLAHDLGDSFGMVRSSDFNPTIRSRLDCCCEGANWSEI